MRGALCPCQARTPGKGTSNPQFVVIGAGAKPYGMTGWAFPSTTMPSSVTV